MAAMSRDLMCPQSYFKTRQQQTQHPISVPNFHKFVSTIKSVPMMHKKQSIFVAITLLWLVMAVAASPRPRQRTHRTNYDALLQNKSYVQAQLRCMLEEGECDRIGTRIKDLLPDAIKLSKCPEQCTEEERRYVPKIHDLVKKDYPEEYKRIRKIYADDGSDQDEEEST